MVEAEGQRDRECSGAEPDSIDVAVPKIRTKRENLTLRINLGDVRCAMFGLRA